MGFSLTTCLHCASQFIFNAFFSHNATVKALLCTLSSTVRLDDKITNWLLLSVDTDDEPYPHETRALPITTFSSHFSVCRPILYLQAVVHNTVVVKELEVATKSQE